MSENHPRIVFMGTPQFAVSALKACLKIGNVVLVVTQPDKPVGRGGKFEAPPVKKLAEEHGIPVLQPAKVKGFNLHETVKSLQADVAVVAAYGKILPQELLDAPKFGCVNVHASLLPRYRGAAPVQWAIANREKETGVSLMKMEAGLDTGPFFAQTPLAIDENETGESLLKKLEHLGGEMLETHLIPYLKGQRSLTVQRDEDSCYAPIIKKIDGAIDFERPAAVTEARLRAFTPWPGAFTHLNGKLLKIHALKADDTRTVGTPGEVIEANKTGIAVATKEGVLVFTEVQGEGGKRMAACDFLKGHPVPPGTRLGTRSGE